MSYMSSLYKHSLVLLTDLYQLSMAYGYWKSGIAHNEAVFHLFFRKHPFNSGFSIACGLHSAIALLQSFEFQEGDLHYLATLRGNDDKAIFNDRFLTYLQKMKFSCDVEAIPEGTVVFPHEPLVRIKGPLIQCQLLETALLNCINFQTLIATKSARVFLAARGAPVLEFGLRRAQGIDGALTASRAAYIGGCTATSNVLAGKLFDIPVKGTHAHSWVMCFDTERESFDAYADAMPNNCVFLVDTYDTLEGVHQAVAVGKRLRERGHELIGIRLDSGDLGYLSIEARKILDQAGFHKAVIIASNDLDEHIITRLQEQSAAVNVWGVGTKLATAYDQPALGGVYKLSAIRTGPDKEWKYRVKLSEEAEKSSLPGILQVRRFFKDESPFVDLIFSHDHIPEKDSIMVDRRNMARRKILSEATGSEDLLVPIFRQGKRVYELPHVSDIRQRAIGQLAQFHNSVKRLVDARPYTIGLESNLHEMMTALISDIRPDK